MEYIFQKSNFTHQNIIKLIRNIPDRIIIFSPQFKFYFENNFKYTSEKIGVFREDDIIEIFKSLNDNIKFNLRLIYHDKNIEFEYATNKRNSKYPYFKILQVFKDSDTTEPKKDIKDITVPF
jgi:hypothetical protein